MYSCFYETKKFLERKKNDVERRKKTENGENLFFKALAKKYLLTSKSCSWPNFNLMDFMKR